MKTQTIATAAEQALISLGRDSTAQEIYMEIVRLGLYRFNTPNPEHVVETELKRYSAESPRSDKREHHRFNINPDQTFSMASAKQPTNRRSNSIGMKRILRASDKESLIEELMSSRVGIFKEIWRLLLFAAQVGMQDNKREALKSVEPGKGIDQSTFGTSASWPGILYLVGLVEAGESQVLTGTAEGEDQRILLFQEFANGGLSIMQDFFRNRSVDLDGVLSFIDSKQVPKGERRSPDLDLSI